VIKLQHKELHLVMDDNHSKNARQR